VYRAFQLLHQLSTSRLTVKSTDTTTAQVIATIEKTNSSFNLVRLLLSNYEYNGNPITSQSVVITLSNVPGQVAANAPIRRIDDTHANALPVWKSAGSPTYPTAALISQMDQASQLVVEQTPVASLGNGQYSITVTLPAYGVADIQVSIPTS